jgi:hypothetical protein
VYSTVLFRLLELIIMDVIAGHVVYFDRNVKSMFYVDYKPASQEIISGKGIKENMKIPLVDFKVTNYRMPIILLTRDIKLQLCVSALFLLTYTLC